MLNLTDNAKTVITKRYLRRGEDGKPIETIDGMFWRVARTVGEVDKNYGEDPEPAIQEFYDIMTSLEFLPNSPTFTGAGTPLGNLSACFVLPISDDLGKGKDSIFGTLRNAALIQQTGGGVGFDFSSLRPKDDLVNSSMGKSTGPCGFIKVYDKAFGEISQGGCVSTDSLVATSSGLLYIDEIVDAETSGWQDISLLYVSTQDEIQSSPQGYNNGISGTLKVTTECGLSICGTPEHKILCMTDDGMIWRRIDKLESGDWVVMKLGGMQSEYPDYQLAYPQPYHGNQKWPTFPERITAEFAFFLGYLTGNGFVASRDTDYRVGVSIPHKSYLITEMPLIIERLFGVTSLVQQKKDDKSITLVIHNRAVKEFLLMNGLGKSTSINASVPKLIRQTPYMIAPYLCGLFEADGAVRHGYPALSTASKTLANEIAIILISIGCPINLREVEASGNKHGNAQMYEVKVVSSIGLDAWNSQVFCDYRSRFMKCREFTPDTNRESVYNLPNAEYWVSDVLNNTTDPVLRKKLLRYTRGDRNLTLSAYNNLHSEYDIFKAYAKPVNNLWFTQVNNITDSGKQLTLDLEVENTHSYTANGMVVHNSRRGACMGLLRCDHPDIFEFIRLKEKEGSITNFNLSVGITDEFMSAVQNNLDWDLINPRTGDTNKTIRARELYDEIVSRAWKNGEPGVIFLDAINRYNPVPHLYDIVATNPCITGDTLIATADGRSAVSIKQLAEEGNDVPVYCYGPGGMTIRTGRNPRKTRTNVEVYKVTLDDGSSFRATPDHKVMTYYGSYEPVSELVSGNELLSFSNKRDNFIEVECSCLRVVSVKSCGQEDVYNITVDDYHNYACIINSRATRYTNKPRMTGIIHRNCGEQPLGPKESCCLGSINLSKFVLPDPDHDEEPFNRIDWQHLSEVVKSGIHFLDNVIDANGYVLPELEEAAKKTRRVGLGIMGLADMLYMLRLGYDTHEARNIVDTVMGHIDNVAYVESVKLAIARGSFPAFIGSTYEDSVEGIRNSCRLSIAPTGSIATVSGCEGYGCEPVFALAYTRKMVDGDKEIEMVVGSPLFEQALTEAGIYDPIRSRILKQVAETGSCQDIPELPDKIKEVFVVASDISAEDHIKMQAVLQSNVDGAISKTINFPNSATEQDIYNGFMQAWKSECKGLTVYRQGSRDKVVLETKKTEQEKETVIPFSIDLVDKKFEIAFDNGTKLNVGILPEEDKLRGMPMNEYPIFSGEVGPSINDASIAGNQTPKRSRIPVLDGETHRVETALGTVFVTINDLEGEPYEVFVNVGKGGSDISAMAEAIGRLISLIFRLVPGDSSEKVVKVIDQLRDIGGRTSFGFGSDKVGSVPDAISQALRRYEYPDEDDGPTITWIDEPAEELNGESFGEYIKRYTENDSWVKIKGRDKQLNAKEFDEFAKSIMSQGVSISEYHSNRDICPQCGQATLVRAEGCRRCMNSGCGYTEC